MSQLLNLSFLEEVEEEEASNKGLLNLSFLPESDEGYDEPTVDPPPIIVGQPAPTTTQALISDPVVRPIEEAVGALFQGAVDDLGALYAGYNKGSFKVYDTLDGMAVSATNWFNQSWRVLKGAIGGSPGTLTPEGGLANVEEEALLESPDFFRYLMREHSKGAFGTYNETFVTKTIHALGESIPIVIASMATKMPIVAGASRVGAGPIEAIVAGQAAMTATGYALFGPQGGADFLAIDMLNTILGPYSRLISATALGSYMYGTAKLAGATDEEALSSGVLGMTFGVIGPGGHENPFQQMRIPVERYFQRRIDNRELNVNFSKKAKELLETHGMDYLKERHYSIYKRIALGVEGKFTDPSYSPVESFYQTAANVITGRDPALKVNTKGRELIEEFRARGEKGLAGIAEEVITFAALRNPRLAQGLTRQHIRLSSENLTKSLLEADTAYKADGAERAAATEGGRQLTGGERQISRGGLSGEKIVEPSEAKLVRLEGEEFVNVPNIGKGSTIRLASETARGQVRFEDGTVVSMQGLNASRAQKVISHMEATERSVAEGEKATRKDALTILDDFKNVAYREMVNSEGKLRTLLPELAGKTGERALEELAIADRGAGAAFPRIHRIQKQVFGKMNSRMEKQFGMYVDAISRADKLARTEGRPEGKEHKQKFDRASYEAAAEAVLGSLTKREKAIFRDAAEVYFEAPVEALELLQLGGFITPEGFAAMKTLKYQPEMLVTELQKVGVTGGEGMEAKKMFVSDSPVKFLGKGHKADTAINPRRSIAHVQAAASDAIFRNTAVQTLARVADTQNAHIKHKRFRDAKKIPYWEEGVKKELWVTEEVYNLWNASPHATSWAKNLIGWASGTIPLKAGVTTYNPAFPIVALPRDLIFSYLQTDPQGYPTSLLKAAPRMIWNLGATVGDVILRKGEYLEYIENTGGQGTLAHTNSRVQGTLERRKIMGEKRGVTEKGVLGAMQVLSYLSETGESWMRISLAKEYRKNGMGKGESYVRAQNILNFGRGGRTTRSVLDPAIPFANASMQAIDSLVKSARRDPESFALKVGQVLAAEAFITFANMKTNEPGWLAISEEQKVRNYIMMLGPEWDRVDSAGNIRHAFFRIKKEHGPLTTPFSAALQATIQKMVYDKNPGSFFREGMIQSVPFQLGSFAPPTVEAVLALKGNFDVREWDDIYKGPPANAPERFNRNTPEFWKWVGQEYGLPPEQTRAAMQKLHPANFVTGWVGYALSQASEDQRADTITTFVREAPGFRKFISWTHPFQRWNEEIAEAQKQAGSDKQNIRSPILKMLHEVDMKRMTTQEVFKAIGTADPKHFSEEFSIFDRNKMETIVDSYQQVKPVWDSLVKKHGAVDIGDNLPGPFWYSSLASLAPKQRAIMFHEVRENLTKKHRSMFDNLVDAYGKIRNNEEFEAQLAEEIRNSQNDPDED